MSDKFNTEMTIEQLVEYIRRCPKQFVSELPDKLEKYLNAKLIACANRVEEQTILNHLQLVKVPDERKALRTDMTLKILANQNIHITTTPEHLAEYVVSLADAIIDNLERTP